jgi:hypothetical protein
MEELCTMHVNKLMTILIVLQVGTACATTLSFDETRGIAVTLVNPDAQTRLFYTKGFLCTPGPRDTNGFMVTAQYFKDKSFCPIGVIVHNKSNEIVKISATSVGSQQRSIDTVLSQCCGLNTLENDTRFFAGLALCLIAYSSLLERAPRGVRRTADSFWSVVIGGPLTVAFLSCFWLWCSNHSAAKARALSQYMLNEEVIIKPGQKVIRYILLDSCVDGMQRAENDVLNGLQFTVFNADGSPRVVCKCRGAS